MYQPHFLFEALELLLIFKHEKWSSSKAEKKSWLVGGSFYLMTSPTINIPPTSWLGLLRKLFYKDWTSLLPKPLCAFWYFSLLKKKLHLSFLGELKCR